MKRIIKDGYEMVVEDLLPTPDEVEEIDYLVVHYAYCNGLPERQRWVVSRCRQCKRYVELKYKYFNSVPFLFN